MFVSIFYSMISKLENDIDLQNNISSQHEYVFDNHPLHLKDETPIDQNIDHISF